MTQAPVIYVTATLFAAPDNDGVTGPQVGPMFFGEVIEGEQGVELVHYFLGGLGEVTEGVGEGLGGSQGLRATAGVVDGLDGRFSLWVKTFW